MNKATKGCSKTSLDMVCVSDVEVKPINWLWPGRIAKGKISLIAGHPGQGKSTVTVSIAAIVSSGGVWPVDDVPAEPANVVILSSEDDVADTIKPRLIAAGADVERVYVIRGVKSEGGSRLFSLRHDLEALESIEAGLLVIDPVTAYLDGVDSHKNAEVRSALQPIVEYAARKGIAVLCVSHLNKAEKLEAISRVSGSMAFVATARGTYLVEPDRDDASRRLFYPLKNNIGRDTDGLAFRLESRYLKDGVETSVVVWESMPVPVPGGGAEGNNAVARACKFLSSFLGNGSIEVTRIREKGEKQGHSWSSLRRAKDELGIRSRKEGMSDGWIWALPSPDPEDAQDAQDAQPGEVSTFVKDEHLRAQDELGRTDG